MSRNKRYSRYSTLAFISCCFLFLSARHPFVKYPIPPVFHKKAIIGAVGAGSVGAVIGAAATGTGALVGAGIGALIGISIDGYLASESHWVKKLRKENIQVMQVGDVVRVIIPSDKIFFFNSPAINPSEYPVLLDVVHFVKKFDATAITISSYGDNVGSELFKLKLTSEQAKSVAALFWSQGVPHHYLQVIGYGSINSIATNNHPIGSAYNRRIVISFPVVYWHDHFA